MSLSSLCGPRTLLDDEVWLWRDGAEVHLAVNTPGTDRVALTPEQARVLGQRLLALAIRSSD